MQTSLQAGIGDRRMPEIRNGHDNGLEVFLLGQHVLVILIIVHLKTVGLVGIFAFFAGVVPNVTERDHLDVARVHEIHQRFRQHPAFHPVTHQTDVDRAQRGFFGGRRGLGFIAARGQQQAGASSGGRAEKFAAVDERFDERLYHFLRSASLLCRARIRAKATNATWMPSQEMPSSRPIKINPTVNET